MALMRQVCKPSHDAGAAERAPSERFAAAPGRVRIRPRTASAGRVRACRVYSEEIDLDRDHVRVGERLHPKEALVLRAEDAGFEIGEIVELANFFCLVRVVQMPNEPIGRVPQDVALNRADLLRRIHEPDMVLVTLFRGTNPDVRGVQIARRRQDVVRLLHVDEGPGWLRGGWEQVLIWFEDACDS